MRVSKRVNKEPIWLASLNTFLRSLADMEIEVKAMRAELDERNRLQIAILNEFKRKQEEEIAAYIKVTPLGRRNNRCTPNTPPSVVVRPYRLRQSRTRETMVINALLLHRPQKRLEKPWQGRREYLILNTSIKTSSTSSQHLIH